MRLESRSHDLAVGLVEELLFVIFAPRGLDGEDVGDRIGKLA
jgi:hypothetical protein